MIATSKTSKTPFAASAGSILRYSEDGDLPSAGFAGSSGRHSETHGEPCRSDVQGSERRRRQALADLERNPAITHAFVAEPTPDGGGIVTLAIRNIGSGDLHIPPGRYGIGDLIAYFAGFAT
jgi:hypothetical protein